MRKYAGHEAVFLIPNDKLGDPCKNGLTVQDNIEKFLTDRHGAFRIESSDIRGFWKGAYDGIYTKFVVAFIGEEKIPELQRFLETLALKIGHESIYFRAGVKTWILYPEPNKKYPAI